MFLLQKNKYLLLGWAGLNQQISVNFMTFKFRSLDLTEMGLAKGCENQCATGKLIFSLHKFN